MLEMTVSPTNDFDVSYAPSASPAPSATLASINDMLHCTLARKTSITGHGLHRNTQGRLEFSPTIAGRGIRFYINDTAIIADYKLISDTSLCSLLSHNNISLSTIEHVMAALTFLNISDLDIIYHNEDSAASYNEIPIMDGSAIEFVKLFQHVGVTTLTKRRAALWLRNDITVKQGDSVMTATPSARPIYRMDLDYGDGNIIGKQTASVDMLHDNLVDELASARTFCLKQDIDKMREIGLAQGGSLDNAIVVDGMSLLNPDGLRYENEFARHKLLDMIGDLSLCSYPIMADIHAVKGGHGLNNQFLHHLFSNSDCFEIK